ncbi:MAG: pilin [Patescibacteria group bacterium]
MKNSISFLRRFGLPFLVVLVSLLLVKTVFAAGEINTGISDVESSLALSDSSPVSIVIRIIQIALSFLGFIAVVIVIYAGFLWMTSGGNEDKIAEAKRWLKNGAIGLLIILSAWGLVTFVIKKLINVTGGSVSTGSPSTTIGSFNNLSLGAMGSCVIESVYPQDGKKEAPRNTSILITFKEKIQLDTVCVSKTSKAPCSCDQGDCSLINPANIQIYKTSLGNVPATNFANAAVSFSSDERTMSIRPLEYLGASNGNVEYAVRLTNNIKKVGGESLFKTCSADFFEWKFETSNKLDLDAPQVLPGGVFPPVDNQVDVSNISVAPTIAQAQIAVTSCPKVYSPAQLVSVKPQGSSVAANVTVDSGYSGAIKDFTFDVVPAKDKVRLYSGSNLLGTADILNAKANFVGYFSVVLNSDFAAGNSWEVNINPSQSADNLIVGSTSYIFVSKQSDSGNGIVVPAVCDLSVAALNMELALSSHSDIVVSRSGGTLTLKAKLAGISGNSLALSSNSQSLTLRPFTGGKDRVSSYEIKGKKDKPMNSVIQINFNEAMNPSVLVGTADELKNYIQVVNANTGAIAASGVCANNSDCLSYNCQAGRCVGSYISGKYSLSSDYDTVEFTSDKECGVNSCGEVMYCLPPSSHLSVRVKAASLKQCATKDNCLALAPYSECSNWTSGKVCRDITKNVNYPLADTLNLNGAVDLAFNSLDGNRDNRADGPVSSVYPYFVEGDADTTKRDGFEFSFYIGNQVNLDPPSISLLKPTSFAANITAKDPVVIDFNDLMMNNSLRTGSVITSSGSVNTEHKLINLRNAVNKPLGYWITTENKEVGVLDGEPDITSVKIGHSDFFESVTYLSQVGSGVKNIYQNCFKPSTGPACTANDKNPSCCFGSATSALDKDGNCLPLQ